MKPAISKRPFLLIATLFPLLTTTLYAAPPAAELRNGRWQPLETATTAPAADPQLDRIEQMLAAGETTAALKLDLFWVKNHDRHAALRDRAVFLLAQANFQKDDRIKAFYFCDEVMDEYPESRLFYPALEKQFQIANDFLAGHKLRFLGMPIVPAYEEAVEMLYRIQQRSPGSPLAEKALLRTADYYYTNRDFDLAYDAYNRYVKDYPSSPLVPNVKLRAAFSSLAQFRGLRFDPSVILDARTQLLDIMMAYPDLARDENLSGIVAAIDDTLSAKLYVTADYYRRTNELPSAVYIYRYLLITYPNAKEVDPARRALQRMPQWALNQPLPQAGEQYLPPIGGFGRGRSE